MLVYLEGIFGPGTVHPGHPFGLLLFACLGPAIQDLQGGGGTVSRDEEQQAVSVGLSAMQDRVSRAGMGWLERFP